MSAPFALGILYMVGMAEQRPDGGWSADGSDVWWTINPTSVGS